MCGRLNFTVNPQLMALYEQLGVKPKINSNPDLRPTQSMLAISAQGGLTGRWGIKPSWSKKLLINAQSEKLAISNLWKPAFKQHRCLVPVSGWYEWRKDDTGPTIKFSFTAPDKAPMLMAGLYWPLGVYSDDATVVTLTTTPNNYCSWYHNRMPVIIPVDRASLWLKGETERLAPLLHALPDDGVIASEC